MDNKFMTSREEELFLENQQLKSQLAEQEVLLREFIQSTNEKPSRYKLLTAKVLDFRAKFPQNALYEGIIAEYDEHFNIKINEV